MASGIAIVDGTEQRAYVYLELAHDWPDDGLQTICGVQQVVDTAVTLLTALTCGSTPGHVTSHQVRSSHSSQP